MTVGEIKQVLAGLPDDATCFLHDAEEGWLEVSGVRVNYARKRSSLDVWHEWPVELFPERVVRKVEFIGL